MPRVDRSGIHRLLSPLLCASVHQGRNKWSEGVVKTRERRATVAQHTHEGKGRKGPQLPGICQDRAWVFIFESEMTRQCVLHEGNE